MPAYPKKHEREYAEMTTFMIEQMEKRYLNQVFKAMNEATIQKFAEPVKDVEYPVANMIDNVQHGWTTKRENVDEFKKQFADAQTGNYAVIFTRLSRKAKRKILKQFSNGRIEAFTKETLGKVDKYNKETLYGRLEGVIGIDRKQLMAQEAMKSTTNALMLETAQWSKKLRDDTLEFFTANSLRMMTLGKDYEEILSEFKKTGKEKKNHAKFIARNQVASFNSLSSKIRAQNLGIEEAIWVTAKDERVRKCHEVRDGKKFNLSEGLYSSCDGKTLIPGIDFSCRCISQFIVGEDDGS